jgi:2-amino-4-hydroxy-6-hydroxymethyldihydropteridine diphosphokinase
LAEAVIALGSNEGEREDNLRRALSAIERKMSVVAKSSVYETEPMYLEDQRWFLNCVVVVETDLEPRALLAWLKEREVLLGRKERAPRNSPRVIDMDLLLYGDAIVVGEMIEVPHPRLAERAFVLVPLDEVRPSWVHPVLGKTVGALLKELGAGKTVVRWSGPLEANPPSQPRRRGRRATSGRRRAS